MLEEGENGKKGVEDGSLGEWRWMGLGDARDIRVFEVYSINRFELSYQYITY